VDGRKISGTGGTDLHDAILFQGTLLVDLDVKTMVRALRVPVEKLRRREMENMRERVTTVTRELGRTPPRAEIVRALTAAFEEHLHATLPPPSPLLPHEADALARALPRYRSREWIFGRGTKMTEQVRAMTPSPGGMLRPTIRTSTDRRRIEAIVMDGDFFAFPRRGVLDLEARLKGASTADLDRIVRDHMEHDLEIPGCTAAHVVASIREALDRDTSTLPSRHANAIFPVNCRFADIATLDPSHLLLPYCAKPLTCELRSVDGCDRCGDCPIGDCYDIGERAGLVVHTITSFEHLMETLHCLAAEGAPAFVGSCCEAFYIKHREEMESAGIRGVLFDVADGDSCYDLGKNAFAYDGDYDGESDMDMDLLEAVMRALKG
jgi:lipoate-protein ligase A